MSTKEVLNVRYRIGSDVTFYKSFCLGDCICFGKMTISEGRIQFNYML